MVGLRRRALLAPLVALLLTGCSDPKAASRALDDMGFTDVRLHGWSLFGCGNDGFTTRFEAKNPQGKRVSGVVCSAWFKGSTVRFD